MSRPRSNGRVLVIAMVAALVAAAASWAGAPTVRAATQTLNVTTTADPNTTTGAACPATILLPCSLRKAVEIANGDTGDTINVPNGHYTLTQGELSLGPSATINGGGTGTTIIDGNHSSRVFSLGGPIVVNDVTITNGLAPGNSGGGGIAMGGGSQVSLNRVAMTDNSAPGNPASALGGAIFVEAGSLSVSDSSFTGNHAGSAGRNAFGSAILINGGALVMSRSTVSGNDTSTADGALGAIALLAGNTEAADITNSTISDNTGVGGSNGIYNDGFTTNVSFSTIASNAGQDVQRAHGTVTIKDTIVSGASPNCSGTVVDGGHNIDSGATCAFTTATGSQPNTDPLLAALANNGGPTQTRALAANSPAIDKASPDCPPTPATDQRGVARPQLTACDIGAFEFVPAAAAQPGLPASGLPNTSGPDLAGALTGAALLVVMCLAMLRLAGWRFKRD